MIKAVMCFASSHPYISYNILIKRRKILKDFVLQKVCFVLLMVSELQVQLKVSVPLHVDLIDRTQNG